MGHIGRMGHMGPLELFLEVFVGQGRSWMNRSASITRPLIVYWLTIWLAHLRNWTARMLLILKPMATITCRL